MAMPQSNNFDTQFASQHTSCSSYSISESCQNGRKIWRIECVSLKCLLMPLEWYKLYIEGSTMYITNDIALVIPCSSLHAIKFFRLQSLQSGRVSTTPCSSSVEIVQIQSKSLQTRVHYKTLLSNGVDRQILNSNLQVAS